MCNFMIKNNENIVDIDDYYWTNFYLNWIDIFSEIPHVLIHWLFKSHAVTFRLIKSSDNVSIAGNYVR